MFGLVEFSGVNIYILLALCGSFNLKKKKLTDTTFDADIYMLSHLPAAMMHSIQGQTLGVPKKKPLTFGLVLGKKYPNVGNERSVCCSKFI